MKNLGILRQAEFEMGDMTIICGENNTGKTYATYALYGFLSYWREGFELRISSQEIKKLFVDGKGVISLDKYLENRNRDIERASKEYTELLSSLLASKEAYFKDTMIRAEFTDEAPLSSVTENHKAVLGSVKKEILQMRQTARDKLEVSLMINKEIEDELSPNYVWIY